MRIGFFTDNYLPGRDGIAISVETFREELEKLGHEVFVIAPSPNLRYKEEGKNILRFPAFKGLFYEDYLTSLFFPPVALKQIDELKLDIVHYHTLGQVGFLGAYYGMKRNLPLLTTYHTDYYQYVKHYKKTLPGVIALSLLTPAITGGNLKDYRQALLNIRPQKTIDDWNQKIVEKGVKSLLEGCDVVISPSKKMKDQLVGWNTETRIEILPTGVDRIPTTKQKIKDWQEKLGINSGEKVIAFVGRLGKEKNLNLLLEAYDLILQSKPNTRLLVIGGAGSQTVEADINEKNKIEEYTNKGAIFTGHIPHNELGSLYELSDVFAFPSLTDTQGLVINEAASAGLPVVMIDKDITSVVKNNVNGIIAKPNKEDLAQSILKILNSDELELTMSNESKLLAQQYTEKKQAEKLLSIYQELLAEYDKTIHLKD